MEIIYWLNHLIDKYVGIPACLALKAIDLLIHPKPSKERKFDKILIIKLTLMGDTILLYPSVRELKKKYPQASIDILCTPINKEIVSGWDNISEYIVADPVKDLILPWKLFGLIKKLRAKRYDIVLDFEEWYRITPLIAYFTGAGQRVGFRTKGQYRHYLYTGIVGHSRNKHEVECFLDIIRSVGVENPDPSLELKVSAEALESAKKIIDAGKSGEKILF